MTPAQRWRCVEARYPGMREGAAQECGMEHSRQLHVIHEQRLPREQPPILIAFDRFAEIARRHALSMPIFPAPLNKHWAR